MRQAQWDPACRLRASLCGALKDRHQNIGKGFIGEAPFKELLKHPAVVNAPLILETPGMEPEHGEEIALLKKLRG